MRLVESAAIVLFGFLFSALVLNYLVRRKMRGDFDYATRGVAWQAVKQAKTEYNVGLDFSADSMKRVEEVLGKMHEDHLKKPLTEKDVSRLSIRWGAYIGEVMKRVRPGKWSRDSENVGAGTMPLIFDASNEAFPCSWVHKRIVDGPEDNVVFKFQVFQDPRLHDAATPKA